MCLVHLVLSLLSGDSSFDTRQVAEVAFRAAWPLSAPLLLIGRGSDDAELRFRCRRVLAGKSVFWSLVGDVLARPSAAAVMFCPHCTSHESYEDADGLRAAIALGDLFASLLGHGRTDSPR